METYLQMQWYYEENCINDATLTYHNAKYFQSEWDIRNQSFEHISVWILATHLANTINMFHFVLSSIWKKTFWLKKERLN